MTSNHGQEARQTVAASFRSLSLTEAKLDVWTGAVIVVVVAVFTVHHDIYRYFLAAPDPDLAFSYQALLLNDGLKQELHAHTGYIYYLALAAWTKFLALIGVIPADRLSRLPGPDSFDAAYAEFIFAGRWLSVLCSAAFAWVFHQWVKSMTGNPLIAALATCLFVMSPALIVSTLFLRPEIWAMLFLVLGLICLDLAVRDSGWRGVRFLFFAGFFAMLAVESKIQVIPLVLAYPLIAIVFRDADPVAERLRAIQGFGLDHGIFLAVVSVVTVIAGVMIFGQIFVAENSGTYQLLIVAYFFAAVWIYGWRGGVPWRNVVMGLGAVAGGVSCGQLVHLITNDIPNTSMIANFLEQLSVSATDGKSLASVIGELPLKAASTFEHWLPFARPVEFQGAALLYWCMLAALVSAAMLRRWNIFARSAGLAAVAFGMEVFCNFRGVPARDLIFIVPFQIAALAVVAAPLIDVRIGGSASGKWLRGAGLAALVALAGINLHGSAQSGLRNPQPASAICQQAGYYLHRLQGYFDRFCKG